VNDKTSNSWTTFDIERTKVETSKKSVSKTIYYIARNDSKEKTSEDGNNPFLLRTYLRRYNIKCNMRSSCGISHFINEEKIKIKTITNFKHH
jgi:hypothetical protein